MKTIAGLAVVVAICIAVSLHASDDSQSDGHSAGGTQSGDAARVDQTAERDATVDHIEVDIVIAEVVSAIAKTDGKANNTSQSDGAPDMRKDPKAWLAWAEQQRRIMPLSRPILRTQENSPASIFLGSVKPLELQQVDEAQIGLKLAATCRVEQPDTVVMKLELKRGTVVHWDGTDGPIVRKTTAKTTLSLREGQTKILSRLEHFAESDDRPLIISFCPHILRKND
jgi:hypothetical protein